VNTGAKAFEKGEVAGIPKRPSSRERADGELLSYRREKLSRLDDGQTGRDAMRNTSDLRPGQTNVASYRCVGEAEVLDRVVKLASEVEDGSATPRSAERRLDCSGAVWAGG